MWLLLLALVRDTYIIRLGCKCIRIIPLWMLGKSSLKDQLGDCGMVVVTFVLELNRDYLNRGLIVQETFLFRF